MFADLVEMLAYRNQHDPHGLACVFINEDNTSTSTSITYAELYQKSLTIAGELQQHLSAGERALLFYPPGIAYISAFFGCLFANVIAVPVYLPKAGETSSLQLEAILHNARISALLTNANLVERATNLCKSYPEQDIWVCPTDTLATNNILAVNLQKPDPNQIAFLQYTSGSTANPRGVMLSHANLLANLKQISHCFQMNPQSKGVIWLPPYHDMGLIGGILAPVYNGFALTLMSPQTFIKNPLIWLKIISAQRATISGGPNFAYELCTQRMRAKPLSSLDLSSWEVAFCGAEPINPKTLQEFIATFSPYGFREQSFHSCYGLAENSLLATTSLLSNQNSSRIKYFSSADLQINHAVPGNTQPIVSCGKIIAEHELKIIDFHTGEPLPANEIGEIWIKGPSVASGYYNQSKKNNQCFRGKISNQPGYWLKTGDLGFLSQGELYVTGRLKELIIVYGKNYYPQDIEVIAKNSHPALRPGAAVFVDNNINANHVILVQEVKNQYRNHNVPSIIAAIKKSILNELGLALANIILVKSGSIPKTTSGKIQRLQCYELYRAQKLQILETSLEPENLDEKAPLPADWYSRIFQHIKNEIVEFNGTQSLTIIADNTLADFNLDSIQIIEMKNSVEMLIHHSIPLNDILTNLTIDEFIQKIIPFADNSVTTSTAVNHHNFNIERKTAITIGQKEIYLGYLLNSHNNAYHISRACKFTEPLNTHLFANSIKQLVARHANFRSTFHQENNEIIQRIHPDMLPGTLILEDQELSATEINNKLIHYSQMKFDLANNPLLRFYLFKASNQQTVILFIAHHIIADFWSISALFNELEKYYLKLNLNETSNIKVPTQPEEYLNWYNQYLASPQYKDAALFWFKHLENHPPPVTLPETSNDSQATAIFHFTMDSALKHKIKLIAEQYHTTSYVILLCIYQILLAEESGQTDIIIGTPVAIRSWFGSSDYLGYCVNILPIRINLSDDPNLGLLIKRVHNLTRDIITHSAFPFSDLINKFQPPRLVNQIPFFNTVFIYHNNHLNNENNISAFAINKQDMLGKFAALAVSTEALPPDTIPTDINLTVTAVQTNFICSFEYNSVKFAKTYINRLANKYINLVEKLSAAIDTPISQFSYSPALLTDQQLQRRIKFNATQKHYAGAKRLDTLFHESAKTYPDHLAIATAQYQLSYSELQTQVNRLSNYLLGLNYSREWPIAIIIDKSWQQIAACLGIVSAGFAYLPIDPNLPIDRIYELIKISRVELALTQGDLLEKLTQHAAVKTIKLLALDTAFKHELLLQPVTQPETNFADTDLAYIIFTSGSTGIPKGVMIEHCSAVNTIKDINQRFQVTHKDKLLGLSYLNFDLSVYDIFGIFAAGATLILPDESNIKNPAHWVALIEQYQITLWDSVPMFLQMLIEHLAGNKATSTLLSLRLALLSGDWIPLHLWEKLRSYHSFKAVSLGGATECSIWSNFYEMNEPLPDWKSIPYGSPLANQQLYVYDKLLNHCPDGVIGDLYIAGEGLARGYWQDTLKTNASFLYHPVTKQRIYKTGDLARYRDCDLIEFIGREDNQIKLNGYRVELNEIQLILKNHHAIKDALLLHYNKNNKNMLVAYVIVDPAQTELASGDEEKTNKIIHYLSMHLQNYKIPTSYIYLTAFPLSVNGKVSKDLLPAPEFNKSLADQDAILKNDLQLKLAEIWRNLLNIDIQHMHDNFFKLGGNSLLAVRLANQIKEVFQVEIDVINIFHNQTIEQLAKVISALPKNQITIPLRALPRVISKAKTSATIS